MLYCATGQETSLNKNRISDIQSRVHVGCGGGVGWGGVVKIMTLLAGL